jgi:23S rRNA (cytidine1920-2'-O)/16S rRNA (cytidine1409-2'-O)-methyltransferase
MHEFMTAARKRIDCVLVDRGFADSRHKAQALVLAGQVLADEQKIEKAGRLVNPEAAIRILGGMPFASRAGAKLKAALDHFQIAVRGRICADLGASTGGFTDCLLQYGAEAVHAYDVGTSQLAWKLQSDPRVVVHDGYNVRFLVAGDLPDDVSLLTADLSFISLTKVLEPVRDAVRPGQRATVDLILLVKPQFEVGKGEVGKGGIVRNAAKQQEALAAVETFAAAAGYRPAGSIPSPILGAEGNREFLLYLQLDPG